MSANIVQWLAFGVALLVAGVAIRVIAQSSRGARAESVLVVFVSVGAVVYETGILGTGPGTQIVLLIGSLAISAISVALNRDRWTGRLHIILFAPALLSLWLFVVNATLNGEDSGVAQFSRLAPVAFWLAYGLLLSVSRLDLRAIVGAVSLALALTALITPFASVYFRPCDQFKCGVFDYIYTGPFISENYLAKVASVAVILALCAGRGALRWLTLLLGSLLLLAATSRTAALAVVVAIAVGLLATQLRSRGRKLMVILLVLASTALSVFLFLTASPGDFSNRGQIWALTLQVVAGSPWIGLGIDRWGLLQSVGLLPLLFPHNQVLLVLFSGGVVGCAIYTLMIIGLGARGVALKSTAAAALALITYISVSGLTEVMWNAATIDGHSFVIAVLVAIASVSGANANESRSPTSIPYTSQGRPHRIRRRGVE